MYIKDVVNYSVTCCRVVHHQQVSLLRGSFNGSHGISYPPHRNGGWSRYSDFAKKEIPINPFLFSKLIDQHVEGNGEDLGFLGMEEDFGAESFLYHDKFPI